ncbi:MAG: TSUP family transporter [Spirochaetaceae bacterium]|jgi:uncharacterized membrane protein YfcA|nr:TSUP family transporter [Spirochaetaceae bacterium]
MELELSTFLIVCPLVFLAGLLDSIAGGGGLISLPAYLFAGVPIHFALGTNKLSSIAGTAVASYRYYKNKYTDLKLCAPWILAALAGSALGASLTLLVDERYLQRLLLAVLPVTAVYVFKKKRLDPPAGAPLSRSRSLVYGLGVSFFIGGYDGFFGPGAGTFLILLYCGVAKIDSPIAAGNAKLVNLASNLSSLVLFLCHRRTLIPLGLTAALFSVIGAYIGSGLVIRKGTGVIRGAVLTVLALLFLKIACDTFF